jgi:hypothetical protein
MSVRSDATVESRPRKIVSGWRGTLLIVGALPLYFAFLVWVLRLHYHTGWSDELAFGLWGLLSGIGIIVAWVTIRTAYMAVAPDQLQIGRSPRETIVSFSEIESLVEGLPEQKFLMMKLGRYSHYSGPAIEKVAAMRREAILLRLSGGRFLALYISPVLIVNGDELRACLLERNRTRIVAATRYTPEEIKRLNNVSFNRIGML